MLLLLNSTTNGWPSETRICAKTLYNYIQAGYMGDLTEEDLLLEGKRRKPKGEPRQHSRAAAAAKSISTRPKEADERSEFGHWEAKETERRTQKTLTCSSCSKEYIRASTGS